MHSFRRARTALFMYVISVASTGHLLSPSWAQGECGVIRATTLRVQNQTGVDILRAAANCTDGGSLEAGLAGAVTVDSPIVVAAGMFLSITGENTKAEVRGDSQTRMFEVSRGGGLTLTRLKVSGGAAESGGAILSDSASLTLDSCIFHGNEATNGDGGAVWADGGNVTIVGGEFIGNNASGYGGAVSATGAKLVVQDGSTFKGNTALEGGALYCSGVAESGMTTLAAFCSLSNTEFISNTATYPNEDARVLDFAAGVHGGGAVSFQLVNADVSNSVFGGNHAEHSGGAVLGGNATVITINGCNFENSTAGMFGGAIVASSVTLGGGTQLSGNTATSSGGAVLGWDSNGTITFNDVVCTRNTALESGGCFSGRGRGIVNDGTVMHSVVNNGTVMHHNHAEYGGCIYAFGCDVNIFGGDFMCRSMGDGGFLYAEFRSSVHITGGLISNNVAEGAAGAIYCSEREGATLTIDGGTFSNNLAWESGGVIAARERSTVVKVTGGTFYNNTAQLYGGFVYLDEGASLNCQGITIRDHTAGDQGGGIYARDSTWVNSSCDMIRNQSPQGAGLYLTGSGGVLLENHTVAGNVASCGSVLYITESSVVANGVSFLSNVMLQENSLNRAVQSDSTSVVSFEDCVFDGWVGDTVIYHRNPNVNSVSLDSCDFRGSSPVVAVFSLNSDAKIRNAIVGDYTFTNAGTLSSSLVLVNRALNCSEANVCGPGMCVDSTLGVLCQCLDDETCLDDGGEVSLDVKTYPSTETYSPDTVSFELTVSSSGDETTYTIWELTFDADDLELDAAPSSGILPPGGSITVAVTGAPNGQDVGGDLLSRFYLKYAGSASSELSAGVTLEVKSTLYLCSAFEYAKPLANDTNGVSCELCNSLEGGDGVDCESPGATLFSLPIRQGYWRSSQSSLVVFECFHAKACAGRTKILSADDYCEDGYKGPYCAVCAEGYARGVSNTCHACDSTKGLLLIGVGAVSSVIVVMLFLLAVVFLIGGPDAVDMVHTSVTQRFANMRRLPKLRFMGQASLEEPPYSARDISIDSSNSANTIAYGIAREFRRSGDESALGVTNIASQSTRSESDVYERAYSRPSGPVTNLGTGVELSDMPGRRVAGARMPVGRHDQPASVLEIGYGGSLGNPRVGLEASSGGGSRGCGLGVNIKSWMSKLPLDKFKILVVVWQILGSTSSITGVDFPASYATFLSWINVANLDIGKLFSASCALPTVNFYTQLLIMTLTPLLLVVVLLLTYQMAKRRAGIGRAGVVARRAAWSRHVAAGLLLMFLVFTPASTLLFGAFDCDDEVGDGKIYLRADYSLSCESKSYTWFRGYAMFMVLLYPIGIPGLYAVILWQQRELLNPRFHAVNPEPGEADGTATRTLFVKGTDTLSSMFCFTSMNQTDSMLSRQHLQEFWQRVRARREHPDLAPSMFLWKDFGPNYFYYEVIECGRRLLLTGVLIFVSPHSTTQVATACIFAFVALLGFELTRPHLDSTDTWLYRLGCVVIFLNNFLALLTTVDGTGEDNQFAIGGLLVAVNVLLVIAVFLTSIFNAQQSIADSGDDDDTFNMARTMLTTGQYATTINRETRQDGDLI